MHHGRNPKYIDRNHGGTLIVWDRLFGTFGAEEDEPVYGTTKPLRTWNPVWANLHYWSEMWRLARQASRPLDRLRVLWKRPGWRPDELGGSLAPTEVDRATYRKYDAAPPAALRVYVLVQFAAVTAGAVAFLGAASRLSPVSRAAWATVILLGLLSLGGLLDRRDWAAPLEAVRLALTAALLARALQAGVPATSVLVLTAASLAWLRAAARPSLTRARPALQPPSA